METDSGRIEENGYTSFPNYTEGFLCHILGCIYTSYHTDQDFFFLMLFMSMCMCLRETEGDRERQK